MIANDNSTRIEEVDLFGQDVSVETLDAYMSDNFENEPQASIVALLAATLL